MRLRLINVCLLLAALVGGYFAIQAGREVQQLRAEHQLLKAEVGLVTVGDSTKVHISAVDTGDPLDFAWQIYLPANFQLRWHARVGGGEAIGFHNSANQAPFFDLLRVRIRETGKGQAEVWFKHRSGSSLMGVSSGDFKLLSQSQVTIERSGAEQTTVMDREQVTTLLRVRQRGSPDKPPLIDIRFGTPEAFQQESSRREGL